MKSRLLRLLAVVVAVVIAFWLGHEPALLALGQIMVRNESPVKADAVVVLGGDYSGNRISKAAELVRDGYAPVAFVGGIRGLYGFHEGELAINYAVARGFPRESMVAVLHPALSTLDEGEADLRAMRERGVKSYLLVTSQSHTARAARIFHRLAPDIPFRVVAAHQLYWNDGRWWLEREGRKAWLFEALKTVADYLGL